MTPGHAVRHASGIACLKFNVRNQCLNRVNAFMQKIPKREHLQIAQAQMRRRKKRHLIMVCAICHVN